MAKLVGLVGSIVNKAGTFVFSTWKGIQVARAYQPNVSNPRSASQITQRTHFDFAVQYGIAMNNIPYLKKCWSLITPQNRSPYNEFVSRNLKNGVFSYADKLYPPNIVVSDNNDNVQGLVQNLLMTCTDGAYDFVGLDVDGCGAEPDGFLAVAVYNDNCLSALDLSPIKDARMCEFLFQSAVFGGWPVGVASATQQIPYSDYFHVCSTFCPPNVGDLDFNCFLIPLYSDGTGVITSPEDITLVGNAITFCRESV